MEKVIISTDTNKLELKFIYNFITNSYWGKGRTFEEVKTCIDNSLNFGIYKNEKQIGYARVVTDFIVFAYLMDVFIVESERGKGYSVKLLDEIMNFSKLKNIQNWKLATIDAHKLYEKYGFELIKNPEKMMERNILS